MKCIDVLTNHGTLKNDFIYIKETYEGYELNDIVLANAASKERYFETISLGKSFSKILKETWGFDLEPNLSYPICIGKAGLYFKIPFDKLITFYFQSFISNLINICVKHIPLGQKIGQDCLLKSTYIAENFFKNSKKLKLKDIGGITFNLDLHSIHHEKLTSRIYIS